MHLSTRKLITVVTRLRTINVGNEALSNELLNLVRSEFLDFHVCALERAPRFLDKYSTKGLSADISKALIEFETWAQKIVSICKDQSLNVDLDQLKSSEVSLVRTSKTPRWKPLIDSKLGIRKTMSSLGLHDKEMKNRLSVYKSSSITILNPAGEFNFVSIDPPLRMLLELRVAQLLGSRAGVVNFSFETPNSYIAELFAKIMNKFDFICVRDSLSLQHLLESGLNPEKAVVIADLAFLTQPEPAEKGREIAESLGIDLKLKTAALVINSKIVTSRLDQWKKVVEKLNRDFDQVILLSNEISSDLPFLKSLQKINPFIKLVLAQLNYKDYASLLGSIDLVISTRLHSSVLSMVSGTFVIPIEPLKCKIKGLLKDVNYPISTSNLNDTRWTLDVCDLLKASFSEEEYNELSNLVNVARSKIRSDYKFLLSSIL